jgi:hypothetical protein
MKGRGTASLCWRALLNGHEGWEAFFHLHRLVCGCAVIIVTVLAILIVGPDQ